jgi:hypothetical protein
LTVPILIDLGFGIGIAAQERLLDMPKHNKPKYKPGDILEYWFQVPGFSETTYHLVVAIKDIPCKEKKCKFCKNRYILQDLSSGEVMDYHFYLIDTKKIPSPLMFGWRKVG